MTMHNALWKRWSVEADIAQARERKLTDLRADRDQLHKDSKKKDTAIFESKTSISQGRIKEERERSESKLEKEMARVHMALQEHGATVAEQTTAADAHVCALEHLLSKIQVLYVHSLTV